MKKGYLLLISMMVVLGILAFTGCESEQSKLIKARNNSITNQQVFQQQVSQEDLNVERLIESLENNVELVLATETGSATINHSKNANKWNSFLVESGIELNVEYTAVIAIKTENIKLVKDDTHVIAMYSVNDFYVKSVEVNSRSVVTDNKIFADDFTHDEVAALESIIVAQIKNQVLTDQNTLYQSKQALEKYIVEIGNNFNTSVRFVN